MKGLVLPRWLGLAVTRSDRDRQSITPVFQGELHAADNQNHTLAPNAMIWFGGTPLQTWTVPASASDGKQGFVQLTIEQSTRKDRSVDLCWTMTVTDARGYKYCTTWNIPADWQPGQPLKPASYYAFRDNGYGVWRADTWDTLVAH